jgi:serine/threonine-protein kinase
MGTVIGTPHYMSPEQCQGEEADARSDIYSLGIVLYELLTGVAPFIAKTPTGIAIKHVTERPRPPRELNPNISLLVEKVILRALEKDPNARPQTALDLEADKQKVRESSETEILPPSGSQRQVGVPPPSYDTVLTPQSETDQLTPSSTDRLSSKPTSERILSNLQFNRPANRPLGSRSRRLPRRWRKSQPLIL